METNCRLPYLPTLNPKAAVSPLAEIKGVIWWLPMFFTITLSTYMFFHPPSPNRGSLPPPE